MYSGTNRGRAPARTEAVRIPMTGSGGEARAGANATSAPRTILGSTCIRLVVVGRMIEPFFPLTEECASGDQAVPWGVHPPECG
jgi:hypothetical protein